MRLRYTALLLAAGLAAVSASASAATRIKDKLVHFKLSNGMTVFVYPRHEAPLFTGMLYVDAGSAEEQVGETGLAHVLEHMAFKGTPFIGTKNWEAERPLLIRIDQVGEALNAARQQVPPDPEKIQKLAEELAELEKQAAQYVIPNEYDRIVTREGGQEVNATTDVDYTNYFMTLPSNKLELWAMLESQRMVMPAWREFYKERDVVAEERRMRVEDSPIGKLYEEFIAAAYRAHPYRNPTIGWMPDIYNLTMKKIDAFYKAWYVPENMVAILVGDVDPEEVKRVMERYFGTIPARPSPKKAITVEPPQRGERRINVHFDAEPQVLIGWHKPTFPDPDLYVFEVIQYILSANGRSSRLYERLVKKDALAQEASAFTAPGDKYPNLFVLLLTPRAPHTAAEVEKAALEEIERLKTEPVSQEELERTRNQIDAGFIKQLSSNIGFARQLGYYYIASKDPDVLDKMRDAMLAVTPEDIMRVARKYLNEENRTVATLVTDRSAGDEAPGGPKATAPSSSMSPRPDPGVIDAASTVTISPGHSDAAVSPADDQPKETSPAPDASQPPGGSAHAPNTPQGADAR